MPQRPSGTVTFLFTDIEGSTRLWEERPDEMRTLVAEHDERFRSVIEACGGYVFATGGDGFAAAFGRAAAAVAAAEQCQDAIVGLADIRVRMGINTGEVQERGGDYFGPPVNRTARLMAAGHGGQVLISAVTAELVPGLVLRNLGEHRLRDLGSPMVVLQLGVDEFSPLRTLDALPGNLPVQLTSFVGRDADVKAVAELLAQHRLVTLTGVGGVGKTRLAMQAAADAVDGFADGVWLVEFASIDGPRVVDAVARALGVEVRGGASVEASLLDAVGPRRLLLVLDNCEHVVREVRRVAGELLRVAPSLSILATSREGLRVGAEQLFSVPSLDDDAASQLFVERARASDAGFTLDESSAGVVTELCHRLDGVPLAIELAAARARMFSVDELARRVEQRFRLLTGGRGDIERHQTLRAAIDWSYELLEASERLVFARMSVFAGGGTLDALEAIVADDDDVSGEMVFDVVAGLVDKSLVLADRAHAESRYEMLETIRQYAQERLVESGEAEAVRARHARWFADFARRAGRGLYSAEELVWDERLRPEVDNMQIAVAWAAGAGETEVAMRIGGSFPRQAAMRPLLGTAHLAEIALEVDGADAHPVYARVLAEAGWAAAARGDLSAATELLHRSVAAQRTGARFAAAAFTYLLTIAGWENVASKRRIEIVTEGLALAEASGDLIAATGLRSAYASTLAMDDQPVEAIRQAQRALDDSRALQQPTLEIAALYALGQAKFRSEPDDAIALLRTSVELGRQYHNEAEEGASFGMLAYLEARHGDGRHAVEAIREKTLWEVRNSGSLGAPFYLGTGAFSRVGRHDLVALCDGYSGKMIEMDTVGRLWEGLHNEEIAEARGVLGDELFQQLAARGAALAPQDFNTMLLHEIDITLATMDEQGSA